MRQPTNNFKIVIVDDNEAFTKSLARCLKAYSFMNVAGIYRNGQELLDQIDSTRPDIVFTETIMPVLDGIAATRQIMKKYPLTKVIATSVHDDGPIVKNMLHAGAWSFVKKDINKKVFKDVVECVVNNRRYISPSAAINYALHIHRRRYKPEEQMFIAPEADYADEIKNIHITPTERKVMGFIVKGYSHKQIADKICRSPRTVDTHKQNLMNKFNIRKTSEIVALVVRYNLL